MKLKKGNRILGEDCVYEVVAAVWLSVYLRRADGTDYDCTMDEVRRNYMNIEFLNERNGKQYESGKQERIQF